MTGMSDLGLRTPVPLRTVTTFDAPFAGVVMAGEPPTVWVDAGDFGASACWRAAPGGHLLAAQDAGHGPDGPAAVLPHCPERVADALAGRSSVAPGEGVTIAIGLIRGAVEADALGADNGEWWLTSLARPVLALTGSVAWRARTVDLLRELAAQVGAGAADVFGYAADVVAEPRRLRREAARCEDALFALAPAAAWRSEHAPARVPSLDAPTRVTAIAPPDDHPLLETVRAWTARFVDADVAERVHGALRALPLPRPGGSRPRGLPLPWPKRPRPRLREPVEGAQSEPGGTASARGRTSRRRPVLVAASVAALLVAAGLLWPADEATDAVTAPPSSPPAAAPEVPEGAGQLPLAEAGAALITRMSACADDVCRAAVWEDPSRAAATGLVADAGAAPTVTVLDEYGGVAVLRVEDPTGERPAQVVVVVQDGRQWLVREVYDLADQP